MGMNRESVTSPLEHSDLPCAHEGGVISKSNSGNDQRSLAHNRALSHDEDVIFEEFPSKISFDGEKVAKVDGYTAFLYECEDESTSSSGEEAHAHIINNIQKLQPMPA